METIPKADCEKIGFFRKTHGVRGEMVLEFEPQYEYSIEESSRFLVELDGLLVPFFLSENGFRFKTSNTAILTFEWVETENYARRLVGCSVYLFQNEIIDEEEEPTASVLLNYLLADKTVGNIGTISNVDNYASNIVLTVNYQGEKILVPFNEDLIISIDEKQKILTMDLPEGLIET